MTALKAAAFYFGAVFAAGFALGVVRVLAVVPRLGERAAELAGMPVMLAVILFAARSTVRRFGVGRALPDGLQIGLYALGFLLLAELGVLLGLRGQSLAEYVEGRDPVSGAAYGVMLGVFALMPAAAARRAARGGAGDA
jgi:hypothetical protein